MNIYEVNKPIYLCINLSDINESICKYSNNLNTSDIITDIMRLIDDKHINVKYTKYNYDSYENKIILDIDDAPWP